MTKYQMSVSPEKCAGCLRCQLACSEVWTRSVNPSAARIRGGFGADGFRDYLSDAPVTREALEEMAGNYCGEQGWDPETGMPTRRRREERGL